MHMLLAAAASAAAVSQLQWMDGLPMHLSDRKRERERESLSNRQSEIERRRGGEDLRRVPEKYKRAPTVQITGLPRPHVIVALITASQTEDWLADCRCQDPAHNFLETKAHVAILLDNLQWLLELLTSHAMVMSGMPDSISFLLDLCTY